jgi:histidinol-phosphate phosphatase family protein
LDEVNKKFISLLKEDGAKIDALYYCPHIDEDKCSCRKPLAGMVFRAAEEHNIDLEKSYTVGDSVRDYLLGFNAGAKGIMLLTGHGKKQREKIKSQKIKPLAILKNLEQASDFIVKNAKKN